MTRFYQAVKNPKTHEILFNITSDESFGDVTLFKMAIEHLPRYATEFLMYGAGNSHEMYKLAERGRINLITSSRMGTKYRRRMGRNRRDKHV